MLSVKRSEMPSATFALRRRNHDHALITEAGLGGREGQLDLPSEPRRGALVEDDEVRQRQIDERFGVENGRLARKCERRDDPGLPAIRSGGPPGSPPSPGADTKYPATCAARTAWAIGTVSRVAGRGAWSPFILVTRPSASRVTLRVFLKTGTPR